MTKPLSEPSVYKDVGRGIWRTNQLERRPIPDAVGGFGIYCIEVFEAERTVIVQDNIFELEIPEDLDGAELVKVDAYLVEASTSGTVQVQLAKEDDPGGGVGTDLLTTKISLDVGELNMKDAATQPVIDASEAVVAWGDHIRVDIDNAGSGAKGLGLILYFDRTTNSALTVQGSQGPPGGIDQWMGEWDAGDTYVTNQAVSYGGTSYVAITNVTAGIIPGVTPGWEDYWMVLSGAQKTSAIELIIDGTGYPIDIGPKPAVRIPYNCDLEEVTMLADQTGSIQVDIWKDTYANYPPTNADSITGASPPTISSAIKSVDTILSGWTTALAEDDILIFNVDSCSVITQVTIALKLQKT